MFAFRVVLRVLLCALVFCVVGVFAGRVVISDIENLSLERQLAMPRVLGTAGFIFGLLFGVLWSVIVGLKKLR